MIKGYCKTNLDDYDCSSVTQFVAVPRIGEYVVVTYKGKPSKLRVVNITHLYSNMFDGPMIEVELHN